jgi:hypothetical protein
LIRTYYFLQKTFKGGKSHSAPDTELGTSIDERGENISTEAAKVRTIKATYTCHALKLKQFSFYHKQAATNGRSKFHSKGIKNDPRMVKLLQETMRKEILEKEKEKESFIAENMKKLTSSLAKATNKNVSLIILFFLVTMLWSNRVSSFKICYRE